MKRIRNFLVLPTGFRLKVYDMVHMRLKAWRFSVVVDRLCKQGAKTCQWPKLGFSSMLANSPLVYMHFGKTEMK